ncbi:MAG: F0F1 ATP synthase subunit delta [Betaproteobacteria bacterium]|nr:F0F1 ATP synthase subunit delta [Betaproteobacteria bacterium]
MAELATIARPYAEALYKSSASDLQASLAWLEELAVIAADPQTQRLAEDPKVTGEQVYQVVTGVSKAGLPEKARNFLHTVIDNGRLSALPEVARQFRLLVNAKTGTSDASVFSPFPVEGQALADLATVLEKRFGRKLSLSVQLQPDLIGGIRVVVGDEVLDTSVKARLEQMKVALIA